MSDFETKDSGKRASFAGGMVRDTNTGKMRPDLVRDGPMLLRWIMLMTRGAEKYDARNWMLANDQAALDRYLESADRHFFVWYAWRRFGVNLENPEKPTSEPPREDHAAATFFNINGAEYVMGKLSDAEGSRTWHFEEQEDVRMTLEDDAVPGAEKKLFAKIPTWVE